MKRIPYLNEFDQSLQNFSVIIIFILLGFCARFLPHPANFTPIAAIALFAGTKLHQKWAYIVPIITMLISDYFLGFHSTILYVYGSFTLIVALGFLLKKHYSSTNIFFSTVAGSILFFAITNFGVWYSTPMYPHTLSGLTHCYYMAIPFFRSTLAGDLIYTGVIFGAYEIIISTFYKQLVPQKIKIK